jgi:ABC-2 type transport system permease protein
MSQTEVTSRTPARAGQSGRPASFGHLLLAEWTKIRSVRSTVWCLVAFVVVTIGLTFALTLVFNHSWNTLPPGRRATLTVDPAGVILAAGVNFGQLAICVLGVLVISTEYSTGVIRASLLAVPRRVPMMAAKIVVFAALIIVLGEVIAFGSFFIGALALHSHVSVSLSDPGVLRAVYGTGLYLTVLGLFSLAIGGLIRHTAGGIAVTLAFIIVLEPLASLLPDSWGAHVYGYLPTVAGREITRTTTLSGQVLSAWQGFGVFCLWTVILLAGATILLKRRDA